MKKTNILLGFITLLLGGGLMTGLFLLFKHITLRIDNDKWGMCFMLELVLGLATAFISFSFFYEAYNEENKKGKR
jgi:hypothetical protein